jgi:hypothetical protein
MRVCIKQREIKGDWEKGTEPFFREKGTEPFFKEKGTGGKGKGDGALF